MTIEIPFDPIEASTVIKEFIRTYIDNSGLNGAVVGLSGGVDSAVTAVLCREVLGNKKIHCLFLPESTTPKSDIDHQKKLIKKFNLKCYTKDISQIVEDFEKVFLTKPDENSLANVKARIRMIMLYEYANSTNRLVCGTSNKSELLIGYFTKYGDGGADIQPIGDIYKTQVVKLARYLDIPEEIIRKPPTAGLRYGQTDEDEIGIPYYILDQILYGLETKMPLKTIANKIPTSLNNIKKIKSMRVKSQHKRRTPLIPKIGVRTVGLDWRSPVQEG